MGLRILSIKILLLLTVVGKANSELILTDTVYNYNQLLAYPGFADTICLINQEYGGLFTKDNNNPDIPNGGTIFISQVDGSKLVRIVTDSIYRPEWWDFFTTSIHANQLQKAVLYAKPGIEVHLAKDKTYLIDHGIFIYNRTTIIGDNSTIKMDRVLQEKILQPVYEGDTFILINNPNRFRGAILLDTTSTSQGLSNADNSIYQDNSRCIKVGYSGDTLFLDKPIILPSSGNLDSLGYYPIGSPVFQDFLMLSGGYLKDSITLKGITFDGNIDNWINHDWRVMNALGLGASEGHLIENCSFINMPSENITVSGKTKIINCSGHNLAGSFVHVSNGIESRGVIIDSCVVDSVCMSTNDFSGHCEGAISFSYAVVGLEVSNSHFSNGKEGVLGLAFVDDKENLFVNNYCDNFDKIIELDNQWGEVRDYQFLNNSFINCGAIKASVFTQDTISNIQIIGNAFQNSTIQLLYANSVVIDNNEFTSEDSLYMVSLMGSNIEITNNLFTDNYHSVHILPNNKENNIIIESNIFENNLTFSEAILVDSHAIDICSNVLNLPLGQAIIFTSDTSYNKRIINNLINAELPFIGNFDSLMILGNSIFTEQITPFIQSLDEYNDLLPDTIAFGEAVNTFSPNSCNYIPLSDNDNDGYFDDVDCDDSNAAVNPGQIEVIYNGLDDDCDLLTLDDDLDQDGFLLVDDCDDQNNMINLNATEIPNNGIDEDCIDGDLITTSNKEFITKRPQISPNPTSGLLEIALGEVEVEVANLMIKDYAGKTLLQQIIIGKHVSVDISNYPNGIYCVLLQVQGQFWTERVVKIK